jgi:hypothetical protein
MRERVLNKRQIPGEREQIDPLDVIWLALAQSYDLPSVGIYPKLTMPVIFS